MASIIGRASKIVSLLAALCVVAAVCGCSEKIQRRPYGYLRVGKLVDLQKPETYLAEQRLFVRRDDLGFSVMSTESSFDLTSLHLKGEGSSRIWVSDESASTFALDGKVLTGPAVADLPYFRIELKAGEIGGPADTLYAYIGDEKPKEWRLGVR